MAQSGLIYAQGKELTAPSLCKIREEYFLAATIETSVADVENVNETNKIITLRPEVIAPYSVDRGTGILKGYFAYGKQKNKQVKFDVYAPHPAVKYRFPPKTLETAIALFLLQLNKKGYSINPRAVKFTTQINSK